ncbi:nicotinate-nucleotide--dimethylbenzimidazole phosphoribosyltransferase [Porphyromonas crevioricanis]|uniref:Nicotinate-nucleotide--dimethylbenzimidazole phosphoribosyltransferase n=2 Tax=Porphyromonas crevioricanis TaxID=393921 RepID=A0A0A2FIQ7_9PORP|nr:nicotinate-nucleotide--dimethylbenzimidazole phosphoribosyltransferase [Porphyromonas crevioricanis]KGN89997.1 nicotinate-nucleotide--dimethylbenzimidazole phosphoribosyltransferase [Porphyromonas crevioricanis]KGN94177.1 nicotinate-nucleotide--dimethylbenzimidazole phosphoribosyltransferase [Porphyromonas crevioricanis]SJZ67996.1 nicotinate-nucleotide-dimethylbenzimidazole phosphoribosyltransferase [Porphyromonas crevioricanis]SQH73994.1 Nicotinate-nucleotide--dimethylbenzimidazole phosphor
MIPFHPTLPDETLRPAVIDKINNLTKPKGSLGLLESLAEQICMIQHSLSPHLSCPTNLLFGADHGVEVEGVSLSPRCVTWQQMLHFMGGKGAGITFLCNQHNFRLVLVDAGVDYDFPRECSIIDRKVRKGTHNYLYQSAMSREEMERCLRDGAAEVDKLRQSGCNILSIGEMGIGNTSASSLWMSCLADIDLPVCVGAGSGLDDKGVAHKLDILTRSLARFKGNRHDVYAVMSEFGGFEMVMAVGAMLRAAELHMVILVDGFIMSACMLAASFIAPEVLAYAIFAHTGQESGHKHLLAKMQARPILNLGLRLGEGSGAVCAYPIVESAVRMVNEMDSFVHASVKKYFD